MKTKKAIKRLNKVETLLSDVMNQFSYDKQTLQELLNSAKTAVIRAKETMNAQVSTSSATNAASETVPSTPPTGATKEKPLAAKKRLPPKRKGVKAPVKGRSSKTA